MIPIDYLAGTAARSAFRNGTAIHYSRVGHRADLLLATIASPEFQQPMAVFRNYQRPY